MLSPASSLPSQLRQSRAGTLVEGVQKKIMSTESIQSVVVLGEAWEQFCFHHLCHHGSGRTGTFTGPWTGHPGGSQATAHENCSFCPQIDSCGCCPLPVGLTCAACQLTQRKLKVRSHRYPRDVVCSGCSPLMLPSVISAKHQAWDDQKVYSRKQEEFAQLDISHSLHSSKRYCALVDFKNIFKDIVNWSSLF